MNWDLLLEWTSEVAGGSAERLREACVWLGAHGTEHHSPWVLMHQLACLGHIEVDWGSQKWSAPPPVLTMLPLAGGYGIATGGRTRAFADRLQTAAAERSGLWLTPVQQDDAPTALFLQCEEEREVALLAADLNIPFAPVAGEQLSSVLPELRTECRLYPDGAPNRGFETQRLDTATLSWQPHDRMSTPGLYRVEVPWRTQTWWSAKPGHYAEVAFADGVYEELRRVDRQVLQWQADSRNGTLLVPLQAPLPLLHARAAILCSGLAPTRASGHLQYVNVPFEAAARIGGSLGQQVSVVRRTSGSPPEAQSPAGNTTWRTRR